jgi:hypothetical protein
MAILANKHHRVDPLWHVQVVLLGVITLQLLLPNELIALPKFILPALEFLCVVALQIVTPKKPVFTSTRRRLVVIALILFVAVANITSLELLVDAMLVATHVQASHLLLSALSIYVTNIAVFGLLYWEMDDGGPGLRRKAEADEQDFLFPQQTFRDKLWYPTFLDYMYVSTTNATAFSPTDTLPLSRRAKMLMAVQALLSILVVVLVTARAINIL